MNPSIKITAKPSIHPDLCEFVTNQMLYHGPSIVCAKHELTKKSPRVFQQIFAITGIKKITLNKNSILVFKENKLTWITLGKKIGTLLRTLIQTQLPLIQAPCTEKKNMSELNLKTVQQELDRTINPQIASHKGYIQASHLEGNTLQVTMQGGCQGCSQSSATLTHGVNQVIKNKFPQIKVIKDVTPHEQGVNPYYH